MAVTLPYVGIESPTLTESVFAASLSFLIQARPSMTA